MNREKDLFRLAVVLIPLFGIVAMVVNNSFTEEAISVMEGHHLWYRVSDASLVQRFAPFNRSLPSFPAPLI
jgi:hypothetical protein